MILVTGSGGQLGSSFLGMYKEYARGFTREELDITNDNAVYCAVEALRPRIVINCAAYTDVNGAESNPEEAYKINAVGALNVALAAREFDATLVHISTDHVFPGTTITPYTEESNTEPVNIYGATKLKGEEYVKATHDKHYIVRTAWLYGLGKNTIGSIIDLLTINKVDVPVVMDQYGCPTYTDDLAQAISRLISTDQFGTYHLVNSGWTSWYHFAKLAGILAKSNNSVEPISTKNYVGLNFAGEKYPSRPKYSILDTSKAQSLGIKMRDGASALGDFIKKRADKQ